MDVVFGVLVIGTMKPTGQYSLKDFRTLIICFSSVNSIIKKRPAKMYCYIYILLKYIGTILFTGSRIFGNENIVIKY